MYGMYMIHSYVLFPPKAREVTNLEVATSLMQEILAAPKHTSTPEKGIIYIS